MHKQSLTTFPDFAVRSYIEASRGALHPMMSLAEAYADDVAHALAPIGGQMRPFDIGEAHGPTRPAIIAHRYWCPSCDAEAGEPCRLNGRFPQEYSHESRHQIARRAMWRSLSRELDISTGWTVGNGR